MLAYSEDLRNKALALVEKGEEVYTVAQLFNIHQATLRRWIIKKKTTGSVQPAKNWQKGHSAKITDLEGFKQFAKENQHLTGIEMAEKWGNITPKTIRKWLKRVGFIRKKDLWVLREMESTT